MRASFIQNLRRTWSLEQTDKDRLAQYYLLKWQGSHLASQLALTNSGNIIHNGVVFKIEYYQCGPVDACRAKAVMISFRQVRSEHYTCNYALVRIVQQTSDEL